MYIVTISWEGGYRQLRRLTECKLLRVLEKFLKALRGCGGAHTAKKPAADRKKRENKHQTQREAKSV